MKTTLRIWLASSAVLYLMLVLSCTNPAPEDIVGKWLPCEDEPQVIKFPCLGEPLSLTENPCFVFHPDGTFEVWHVPVAMLWDMHSPDVVSGGGTWSLETQGGAPNVALKFEEINGDRRTILTQIWPTPVGYPVKLYLWIEYDVTNYFFERVSSRDNESEPYDGE